MKRVVLWQDQAPERRAAVLTALLAGGHAVTCPAPDGAVAPADGDEVLVLHESAELGRLAFGAGVRTHSIAGLTPAEVVAVASAERAPGTWRPWFPVIDFQRCTNCMQCLSFCLFGVYGVDAAQKITVKEPDHCKNNCPACSRVCPEVAILFPKYQKGPINGDVVNAQDVEREKMKIDISALLGGDIYKMLRERHAKAASRFSKERDEARALEERKRCLALVKDLDIPPEVLMALPSADEIVKNAGIASKKREGSNE